MKPLRVALVVLGLAVAVYGVASLTGGWLGAQARWRETGAAARDPWLTYVRRYDGVVPTDIEACPNRVWIWAGIAAGLALAVLGAWPRRAKPTPPA